MVRYRKPTVLWVCNPYNTDGHHILQGVKCRVPRDKSQPNTCGCVHLKLEGGLFWNGRWRRRSELAGHYPEALAKAIVKELM